MFFKPFFSLQGSDFASGTFKFSFAFGTASVALVKLLFFPLPVLINRLSSQPAVYAQAL